MKKNIGKTDKIVRILIGFSIIILGAYLKSVWGVFGMIPVISAEIGICPMYLILKVNTALKDIKKTR
jgi:hypothetical protein